jgi:hypothetical protein
MNDDCVAALGLATRKWRQLGPGLRGGGSYLFTPKKLGLYDDEEDD